MVDIIKGIEYCRLPLLFDILWEALNLAVIKSVALRMIGQEDIRASKLYLII